MSHVLQPKSTLEVHAIDDSGELIVHDSGTGQMVVLNPVGAAAFSMMDGSRGADELVKELVAAFSTVPQSTIEKDIREFIDDLVNRDLVRRVET